MASLSVKHCEVCRVGAPLATREEIAEYMSQLAGWQIVEVAGVNHLQKAHQQWDRRQLGNNFIMNLAFKGHS